MSRYYTNAVARLERAFADLRTAARSLPAVPSDGACLCGCVDFKIEERGYMRWTDTTMAADGWRASGDGWDDMSEDAAGPEVLVCDGCSAIYRVPDNVIWN